MKFGSLFAGIGGFDLGFELAGLKCTWQCEKDKFCRQVLNYHWPDIPLYFDVEKLKAGIVEPVDILCGGFPCQDVSIAGQRKGLKGERSGLFWQFYRIVKEMRESTHGKYPKLVVIENVPGLFSSRKGRDFSNIIASFWKLRPFEIGWTVFDSQYFGVPQRRRRVFIVVNFGKECVEEILFNSESLCGDAPEMQKEKKENPASLGKELEGCCATETGIGYLTETLPRLRVSTTPTQPQTILCMAHGQANAEIATDKACSMNCNHEQPIISGTITGMDRGITPDQLGLLQQDIVGPRRLTPTEAMRLQGFPDLWNQWGRNEIGKVVKLSDTQRYKQAGNAVTVNVAIYLGDRITDACYG